MALAKFIAQVDKLHRGEGTILDTRFQFEQTVLASARVLVTFERRRGRAKKRDGAFEPGADDGYVAAIVTRRFFLFVARLLLLIDDDESHIFERREYRRTRAHHNARLASPHAPPFMRAFIFRKPAVQHGDNAPKSRAHQTAEPQRQRDFRHQYNRGAALRERRFHRAKVHFRFSASRDAVQQGGGERFLSEPLANRCHRRSLLRVQHIRGRHEVRFPWVFAHIRFRGERLFPCDQLSLFFEPCDDSARGSGFQQNWQRHRPASRCQKFADFFFFRVNCSRGGIPRREFLHALVFASHAFARDQISAPHEALRRSLAAGNAPQSRGRNRLFACVQKIEDREVHRLARIGWAALLHFVETIEAVLRDLIFALLAQFRERRKHRAQRLSHGGNVIAADPHPEFNQFRRQRGNDVEQFDDFPGLFVFGRIRDNGHADSHHGAIAKRHNHAAADKLGVLQMLRDRVRKRGTKRDRERDFTISRSHVCYTLTNAIPKNMSPTPAHCVRPSLSRRKIAASNTVTAP